MEENPYSVAPCALIAANMAEHTARTVMVILLKMVVQPSVAMQRRSVIGREKEKQHEGSGIGDRAGTETRRTLFYVLFRALCSMFYVLFLAPNAPAGRAARRMRGWWIVCPAKWAGTRPDRRLPKNPVDGRRSR